MKKIQDRISREDVKKRKNKRKRETNRERRMLKNKSVGNERIEK